MYRSNDMASLVVVFDASVRQAERVWHARNKDTQTRDTQRHTMTAGGASSTDTQMPMTAGGASNTSTRDTSQTNHERHKTTESVLLRLVNDFGSYDELMTHQDASRSVNGILSDASRGDANAAHTLRTLLLRVSEVCRSRWISEQFVSLQNAINRLLIDQTLVECFSMVIEMWSEDEVRVNAAFRALCHEIYVLNPGTQLDDSVKFSNISAQGCQGAFVSGCCLECLPLCFGAIRVRQYLWIYNTKLTELPCSFGNIVVNTRLVHIRIERNKQLRTLPNGFGKVQCDTLDLAHNGLVALPADFGQVHTVCIDLSDNKLLGLSVDFADIKCKRVNLSDNQLCELPEDFPRIQCGAIMLSSNNLRTLPTLFGNLRCDSLDLSHNLFVYLPDDFCHIKVRDSLDLSYNGLLALPDDFGDLPCQSLDLSYNHISKLPESFGTLPRKRVDVTMNRLTEFPPGMANTTEKPGFDFADQDFDFPTRKWLGRNNKWHDLPDVPQTEENNLLEHSRQPHRTWYHQPYNARETERRK